MIKQRKNIGLTLIGVMISLNIMTTGLVALLTLVNSTLQAAFTVRSNIEANSLLYDAFETVRNIRDTNILSRTIDQLSFEVWNNGLAGDFRSTGSYTINCDQDNCEIENVGFATTLIEPTDSNVGYRLFKDPVTGIINHDQSGEGTKYYRQILIDDPCDTQGDDPLTCNRSENVNLKQITVYITWEESGGDVRDLIGFTYIGNWDIDEI